MMGDWVSVKDRLPTESGIYPTYSDIEGRPSPQDWLDSLCYFNAEAEPDDPRWEHSSGYYDNGVTHWLPFPPMPMENDDD